MGNYSSSSFEFSGLLIAAQIVFIIAIAAALFFCIFKLLKKLAEIQKSEGALTKRSFKSTILASILGLNYLLLFFAPMFAFLKITILGEVFKVSAWKILFADSELFEDLSYFIDDEIFWLLLIPMAIAFSLIISSFKGIANTVGTYFTKNEDLNAKGSFVTAIVESGAYFLFSFIVIMIIKDEIGTSKSISGAYYLPMIFAALLYLAYYIVLNFMPENYTLFTASASKSLDGSEAEAKANNISESENNSAPVEKKPDNIEMLRSYKQLLDEDIITEEEFNAKKKELLESASNK